MKKPEFIDEDFNKIINEMNEFPNIKLKQLLEFEKQGHYMLERTEARALIKIFTPLECKLIKYRAEFNKVEEIAAKTGYSAEYILKRKIPELASKIIGMAEFDCPKKEPKDVLTWVYYKHKNFFEKNRKYFDIKMDLREHKNFVKKLNPIRPANKI